MDKKQANSLSREKSSKNICISNFKKIEEKVNRLVVDSEVKEL